MNSRAGRKHLRKAVEFAVRVRVISAAKIPAGELPGTVGRATSFSIGGIGFESLYPFQPKDLIQMMFTLPGEQRPISVEGTIQAVRKAERKSDDPRLMHVGIKFQNVSEQLATYFTNYMGSTFLLF